MGYIESSLIAGEQVVHTARIHWKIFVIPVLLATSGILLARLLGEHPIGIGIAVAFFLVASFFGLRGFVRYKTSEFGVTDKRVIIKVGLIRRQTLETLLAKVEGVGVDQTVLGRILNFGTITISGTGGTKEFFKDVGKPLEFRRAVHEQTTQQQLKSQPATHP